MNMAQYTVSIDTLEVLTFALAFLQFTQAFRVTDSGTLLLFELPLVTLPLSGPVVEDEG